MDHDGIRWLKSSYSGGSGTECVEIARLGASVGVRDSKRPRGPHIIVQANAWGEFVTNFRPQREP
ncbi:DUF397 domain-containing protein [Streptomyces sp. NBC_00876]|uniref:DUF397 domain-containing protein n=1 Tax=Streptomyces sp. NBC_00876 TaxID=2975853 RepID=UPI00386B75F7|nr:DUF397 domain-containing protein [Streptomyces sp. NBC_00876]